MRPAPAAVRTQAGRWGGAADPPTPPTPPSCPLSTSAVAPPPTLILSFYLLLAFTGIFAFKEINDLYTLNFQVSQILYGRYTIVLNIKLFIPDPAPTIKSFRS